MNTPVKKADLLNAAERLFYEHGFRGVGLKQIISEANVATMTLYNHFSSKEHLVEEVLKQREERYWSYLDALVQDEIETPFLSAVEAHGKWLAEESYQGDMFLRAIEDYSGANNDIENIARSHKSRLLRYFQMLAKRIGEDDHSDLAHYFTLLLEGTTSMTTLIGVEKATEYAMAMAKRIVY
ncbi:TetR/AcrR family transcriptional regulator [Natribacillus halophilus]|uniref:DNA-binding transcriptional regulator, AcrR family n=1 Tax=Natribacillus halophilus TaxID=549003 RepID=A0A1G8NJC4_9BACI|nr:TetR/AcrR family transcriptional regulator [Natribacillus halophilus]SDI80146.1 DNA-binding transcriptional regulator, AcrR family [Natribacillus halophilus]